MSSLASTMTYDSWDKSSTKLEWHGILPKNMERWNREEMIDLEGVTQDMIDSLEAVNWEDPNMADQFVHDEEVRMDATETNRGSRAALAYKKNRSDGTISCLYVRVNVTFKLTKNSRCSHIPLPYRWVPTVSSMVPWFARAASHAFLTSGLVRSEFFRSVQLVPGWLSCTQNHFAYLGLFAPHLLSAMKYSTAASDSLSAPVFQWFKRADFLICALLPFHELHVVPGYRRVYVSARLASYVILAATSAASLQHFSHTRKRNVALTWLSVGCISTCARVALSRQDRNGWLIFSAGLASVGCLALQSIRKSVVQEEEQGETTSNTDSDSFAVGADDAAGMKEDEESDTVNTDVLKLIEEVFQENGFQT